MSIVKKYQAKGSLSEQDISFQFLPLAVCPLPPKPIKRLPGEDWVKTIGKTTIRIVASSQHGIPFGRDILIVLYLIREALRQGGPVVRFQSLKHYLDTFQLDNNQRHYKEAIERFQRIFYSTWFWEDHRKDDGRSTTGFRIIRRWNVYFDEPNYKPLFENIIELTPEFWEIVQRHPIPYRLDAVIKLKDKPAVLSLYLYLVHRTWQNWHFKRGREFIPFFGDSGLQKQLSSDIAEHKNFRTKFRGWIDEIRVVWPECPIDFERETDVDAAIKPGQNKRKFLKDALFIEVADVNQLHVVPDMQIELGRAIRESERMSKALGETAYTKIGICSFCGQTGTFLFHKGIDGQDDFTTCPNKCNENKISIKKWESAQKKKVNDN